MEIGGLSICEGDTAKKNLKRAAAQGKKKS
jgi:hypothetical protein